MNDQKTILVTGGTGFLGSNLLQRLLHDGYRIVLIKRSFSNTFRINNVINDIKWYNIDEIKLEDIFKNEKIDIILHCATDYGRKSVPALQIIEANLLLPLKLLQFAKDYNVKCFINTDTILDKRVNHYSLSKKQFIDWLKTYNNDLVCVNLALEHFYGPGDDKTKFVSFIFDQLKNKVPSIDLTKGEQKRDFVFIDDVVDAFSLVIKNSLNWHNGFFNYEIGTNKLITIKELVENIKKMLGNNETILNFGALPYRENEVMISESDTTAIRLLGWQPRFDLTMGLEAMVSFNK